MTSQDARNRIGKPELLKLQQLNPGLKIGRVFGERVLVEPIEPYTKMEEAKKLIVIPEEIEKQNKPAATTGIVVQLGDGMVENGRYKYGLEPGMMVMFGKYDGTRFDVDEKKYLMFDFRQIACTLEATGEQSLDDVVQQVPAEAGPDVPVAAGMPLVR